MSWNLVATQGFQDLFLVFLVDINGAPFRYVNDQATVDAKRKSRDQQQQQQQIAGALPGMAAMAKAVAPAGNQAAG